MNRFLTATLIGGALLTSALLSSGTAQAFYDGTSPRPVFLAHIHTLRFPEIAASDDASVAYGYKVCRAIEALYPVTTVQTEVENTLTPKGYTVNEADGFVTYAHTDLCPRAVN